MCDDAPPVASSQAVRCSCMVTFEPIPNDMIADGVEVGVAVYSSQEEEEVWEWTANVPPVVGVGHRWPGQQVCVCCCATGAQVVCMPQSVVCEREDRGCQVEGADLMAAREISSTAVPREEGREAGREGGREGGRKGGMTADSSRYTLSSCCL